MEDYSEEEKINRGLVEDDSIAMTGSDAPAQPPATAEPKVLKPEDVTASGDSNLSFYGSKARAKNQKTGAETWYDVDANGGLTERKDAPLSERIAKNGGLRVDTDSMRKFEEYNRMKLADKAKANAAYNTIIANSLGGGLDDAVRNGNIKEIDGAKYRTGMVAPDALSEANRMLGKYGKNTIKNIMVRQQVANTDDMQMIGDPLFVIEYNEDGVSSRNGKTAARVLTRPQVESIIRKSYGATGEASRGEDVIKTLFRDRAGEIKAEREAAAKKAAEVAALAERKRQQLEKEALERAKVVNERYGLDTERIKAFGGLSSDFEKNNPSKENWARDIFSDPKKAALFTKTNKQAVDADGNPITDDNGMPVYEQLSPEEAVKKALEVYDVLSGKDQSTRNPFMLAIDAMLGKGEDQAKVQDVVEVPKETVGTEKNPAQGDGGSVQERARALLERRKAKPAAAQGTEQPAPQPQVQQPVATPTVATQDPTASNPPLSRAEELRRNGEKSNDEVRRELAGDLAKWIERGGENQEQTAENQEMSIRNSVAAAAKKPVEYTSTPNPRAKASRSIVANNGAKRQRGLDMSGKGYADSAVKSVNAAKEQEREQREFEDLADQTLEERRHELAEMARREYGDWASGDRSKPFKFSRQTELDALNSDNPLANYGRAVVEFNKAILDAIHNGIYDRFGGAVKSGLESLIASVNEYVRSGRAKKDVAAAAKKTYDAIRAEVSKAGWDDERRKEVDEVVKPFRNVIPGMNFAPLSE